MAVGLALCLNWKRTMCVIKGVTLSSRFDDEIAKTSGLCLTLASKAKTKAKSTRNVQPTRRLVNNMVNGPRRACVGMLLLSLRTDWEDGGSYANQGSRSG